MLRTFARVLAMLRRRFVVSLSAGLLLALIAVPVSAQAVDSDGDGLFDEDEVALGTDPARYDTDDDGFGDNHEVLSGTDPLDPSSVPPGEPGAALDDDGDLLPNGQEQDIGTDPNDSDSDDDGISDFGEVGFEPGSGTGTDPLVFDMDGDGVGDGAEVEAGSDPTNPDSVPVDALPSTGTGAALVGENDGFLAAALAIAVAAGLFSARKLAGQRRSKAR
jgi:hypothetical protein